MNFKLSCPAPVKRAFIAQNLVLHEAHRRTAQNQKQLAVFPLLVNMRLNQGRNSLIAGRQIRKFIDHQNKALCFTDTVDVGKQFIIASKRGSRQPGKSRLKYSFRK